MSCSLMTTKVPFHHALFVELPARSSRAQLWAQARGIGDFDSVAFTTMLRAERLSYG